MAAKSNRPVATITVEQVEQFRFVMPQVTSLLNEVRELSKKQPDGAVNKFKLGFVNEKLQEANAILGEKMKPLKTFETFDVDALPSNSDVVLILSQYSGALSRWQTANVYYDPIQGKCWQTQPPIKVE